MRNLKTVVARINRRISPDGWRLRKTRGERMRLHFGDFYVHDLRRNLVLDINVDPEALWEELRGSN